MSLFLFERSISVGIFVIVIVCLRVLLINKIPKKMFLILWGIAMFRLVIPHSIFYKWNLLTFFDYVSVGTDQDQVRQSNVINKLFLTTKENFRSLTGNISFVQSMPSLDTMTIIWLVGAISLGIFFAVTFYKNNKILKTALPIRNQPFIDKWLSQQKTIRQIEVMSSDCVLSPIAYGFIKPRIILPKSLDFRNEELLKHILTHEKMHIKYLDILWKLFSALILCCYWFNPFVWFMHILINRDLELTCDERVLRSLGDQEKTGYALSLIHMAERNVKLISFYYGFSNNFTKERIVSIMKFKQTTVLTFCLSVALIAGTVAVFATNVNPIEVSPITRNVGKNENVLSMNETKSNMTDSGIYIMDISDPENNYGLESYSYEEYKAEMENIKIVGEELVNKGKMSREKLSQVMSSMKETLNDLKRDEIVVYKPIQISESVNGRAKDKDTSALYLSGTRW
ncbi:Regulatory protein BlaR1 [compost metagenome]